MKIVLAGNQKQYERWIRENNYNRKEYIYGTYTICSGILPDDVIIIGTFTERNDYRRLLDMANAKLQIRDLMQLRKARSVGDRIFRIINLLVKPKNKREIA